jgi:YD repeat-containing protein
MPLGAQITYTYGANGNQTSVTNRNGNMTYYTYNAFNEQTSKTVTINLSPVTCHLCLRCQRQHDHGSGWQHLRL